MRLKSRIKRLKEQNREVTVRQYSLFNFDGYNAPEAVRVFWTGAGIVLFLGFLIFIVGNWIYQAQVSGSNPDVINANAQAQLLRDEDDRKDKQQYIDGCKANGKAPTDMSNFRERWECR